MTDAFACWVTRSGRVYWRRGIDDWVGLWNLYRNDPEMRRDERFVSRSVFPCAAQVTITPHLGYAYPEGPWFVDLLDRWALDWWTEAHRALAMEAHAQWKTQVYEFLNVAEAQSPLYPFDIAPPPIGEEQLSLLRDWVGLIARKEGIVDIADAIGQRIEPLVGRTIFLRTGMSGIADVLPAIWPHISGLTVNKQLTRAGRLLCCTVGRAATAYHGVLFHAWPDGYPYQPGVDLWRQGIVPSFDGRVWRLHGGTEGAVLWEGAIEG